jgi:flagellar hook-associated protein 2
MSTISSPGIASGIDIKSIVSQLVALDRAPIQTLKTQAGSYQNKLSVYGSIKSMMSTLGDAASKLSTSSGWNSVTASSSNSAAVSASAAAGATPTSLALEVSNLATSQSAASSVLNTTGGLGAGTLSFSIGGGDAVNVVIEAGKDSLAEVASQINNAKAGVSATIVKDASGERLLMRATDTGTAKTFTVSVSGGNADGLQQLSFPPGVDGGMTQMQPAEDAAFSINGVALTSSSNVLADTVPGLTLTLSQETTAPVEIKISTDQAALKKNVQAFVNAYNSINDMLVTATSYNPDTKASGSLQGDATAIGLQNALRGMMRSVTSNSGPYSRLADIGISAKQGGKLEIDSDKLDAALSDPAGIQALFTTASDDATAQGFGLKIKDFATGMIATDGRLTTRTESLQSAIKRNGLEQEKVDARATRAEARYLAKYNAMDAAVGNLNALSAFVTQQITLWNSASKN